MKTRISSYLLVVCLAFLLPVGGAEVQKANVTTALKDAASWVSGGPPGAADVAVWDAQVTSTTTYTLGESVSWAGLKVVSPALDQTIRPTTGLSLTLGSSGVDMAAATKNFAANATVLLGANQTWNIGAGRTLSTQGLTGSGGLTLTKTGEGILSLTGVTNFAGGLAIGGGSVQSANASGVQELSGALSGSGAFNKTGAGTLNLSGNNGGYSGALTLSAGQLSLNQAGALGGATLNVTGGSLGNTSGAAVMLAAGSVQNWNGDLGYAGTSDLDLGGSAVTVDGVRALTVGSNTLTVSGTLGGTGSLTKLGAGTLRVAAGASIDLGGKLATTGGVLRIDGGTVACGTTSGSFEVGGSGTVELNGGALVVPAVAGLGGSSTLVFNGGVLRAAVGSGTFLGGLANAKVGAGGAVLEPNSNVVTVTQALSHDAALGGAADGGLLVRDDFNGTVTLTGASSYTGPTVIESGTLALGTGGSIAASPAIEVKSAGAFDAGAGTTLPAGQTLTGTGSLYGALTIGTGSTLAPGSGTTVGTLQGNADLILAGSATFRVNKAGVFLNNDAVVCSSVKVGGTLTVTASGTVLAVGDTFKLFEADSYSGSFASLNLPVLQAGFFWDTSKLLVDGTIAVINTVPPPEFSPPGGGYVGSQSVTISSVAGATIHYTTDGSDPQASATVVSVASPAQGIVIPNSIAGFTIKAYATAPGASPSAVVASVYHTLDAGVWTGQGSGAWSEAVNWLQGAVPAGVGIAADFSTLSMSESSAITLDGSRTLGVLRFGDVGNLFDWTVTADGAAILTLDSGAGSPTIHVANRTTTINVPLNGSSGFVKTGAGTLALGGANSYFGNTTISGGTLTARITSSQNALGSSAVAVAAGSTLNLNNVETSAYTTVSNVFSGGGTINLSFANAGTARNTFLDNAFNSFTGTFHLSLASGATSTADKWTCHVAPTYTTAAALIIDPGTQFFVAPNITAAFNGGISVAGTGNTENRGGIRVGGTLVGAITLLGNTTIGTEGGTIAGSITSGMAGTQTLTLGTTNSPSNATLAGAIGGGSGVIALVKTQGGTVILSGANSYTGATTISTGALQIGNGGTTGTLGTGDVTNHSQLIFNRSDAISYDGVISGVGSVAKLDGAGTLTLSGANTYSGSSSISAGKLLVNGSLAAASAVSVAGGATLGGTGTAAGPVTINAGAILAPGAGGTGTLTTGALTLTGTYGCELDGANCDKLTVNGNLNLTGSKLAVAVLAGGSGGGPYLIATYTGTRTGTFATVPAGYAVDYSTPNQVKLTVSGSGDGFATWIGGYGLAGANALPGADPDRDGIANSIEFVLGGNPAAVMDAALLPTLALVTNPGGTVPAGSYLKFTYRRTPASAYLNPGMQYDADLAGTWTAAVPGQAGVVEVVTPGFFTAPVPADKVEVYVPRAANQAGGKLFGRLRVSVP